MVTFKDFAYKGGSVFSSRAVGNILIVQKENPDGSFIKKNIRVVDDPESVVDLKKTMVKASGGAEGLQKFLTQCEKGTDFLGVWVSKVYNHMIDVCREAKV